MTFKKPFRAAPVRLGPYQLALERRRRVKGVVRLLGIALLGGAGLGGVIGLYQSGGLAETGQAGDYWSSCDAARVAGVAPLRFGEPGYRRGLDADGDGVACEAYSGA